MRTKLPRQMIWKAKATLEEFTEEPLGSQLYDLYAKLSRSVHFPNLFKTSPIKLLNEAYYQSTRIVYEKNPRITVNEILNDIKTNIGLKHNSEVTLLFVYYILCLQEDQSIEIKRLLELMKNDAMVSQMLNNVKDRTIKDNLHSKVISLRASPCSPQVIESMLLDWHAITDGFSERAVRKILNLWRNNNEKAQILCVLEKVYHQYSPSYLKNRPDDFITDQFFSNCRQFLAPIYINKEKEPIDNSEKVKMLELRLEIAEKQVNALRLENEHLKSELNMTKRKDQRVRSFTLSLIVDYCKNKIHISQVESIIAMLYKLLRMSGTEEDYALVDSIEEEFSKRKGGQTVEHQTVERQIVIPKDGHYHEHTDTVNNQFPAMPPMVGQRKMIE